MPGARSPEIASHRECRRPDPDERLFVGRHNVPAKRAAHKKQAAPKKSKRAPLASATPALPVLALAITAVASLSAAALGTAQADAVDDSAPSKPAYGVFSAGRPAVDADHKAFGPSSRDLAREALERTPRPKSAGIATAPSDADDEFADRKVLSSGECEASFYNTGAITANGEPFDTSKLTAAHKTLPFNTMVRVTNKANDKSVVVRINDRGPYIAGRCIDLTPPGMQRIAGAAGTADVEYEVLGRK